jgi:hypothetical protein
MNRFSFSSIVHPQWWLLFAIVMIYSAGISSLYAPFLLKPLLVICIALSVYVLAGKKPVTQARVILLCMFMPFPTLGYLLGLMTGIRLLFFKKITCNPPTIIIITFVLFAFTSYLLSNMLIEANYLSYFLWFLTFASPFCVYIYFSQLQYSDDDRGAVLSSFKWYIWLEIPLILFQVKFHFQPTDFAKGSFGDAHITGFYLLVLSFLLLQIGGRKLSEYLRPAVVAPIFILLTFLVVSDAKTLILLFLIAAQLFMTFNAISSIPKILKRFRMKQRNMVFYLGAVFTLFTPVIFPVIGTFYLNTVSSTQKSKPENLISYLSFYASPDNPVAHKSLYYKRIIVDLKNHYNPFIGTGPGTLGSRSSNARSYDMMAKSSGSIKIPFISSFTSQPAKEYLVDLYNSDYQLNLSGYSALLSYPFSEITTILGELGYIGILLYLMIFVAIAKSIRYSSNSPMYGYSIGMQICLLAFLFMCAVDNYQEMPQVIFPPLLLSAVLINKYHQKALDKSDVMVLSKTSGRPVLIRSEIA